MVAEPPGDDTTREAEALRWFAHGLCLSRLDDGAHVLVAGMLPGERARIEDISTRWRRRYRAVEILRRSPRRVPPLCAHAGTCPGCDLLHVDAAEERSVKQRLLQEVLERHAGVHVTHSDIPILGRAARFNHRTRVSLHVSAAGALTLSQDETPGVDLRSCPASSPAIRRLLHRLMCSRIASALTHLEAGEGEGPALWLRLRLREGSTWTPEMSNVLQQLPLAWVEVRSCEDRVLLQWGRFPRPPSVGGRSAAGHEDVWQHTATRPADALHRWVRQHALALQPGSLLDTTCGAGGLTLLLAGDIPHVLACDANWSAVETCRRSAELHGFAHVKTRGGKIQTLAPRLLRDGASFDLILVNPMRSSLGPETMEALAALTTRRLIYLAPAPMAGARDIAALLPHGFSLADLAGADLHPGTGRVMLCAILDKNQPRRIT